MPESPPAESRVAATLAALLPAEDPRPFVYLGPARLVAELTARLGPEHPATTSGRAALAYAIAARPLLNADHGLSITSRRDEYGRPRRVRLARLESTARVAA
ncbi:hypothetical protein GA0074695_1534 [Micromonospora viridifaciens]|uniref:Uncharacterized protein n=1 Tax=Micromonospora viridifaciens TaxID=1881 RepID=A0A1C4VJL1_MICVI|nr:hypothetical protein [Micromonospora viridifaciens]SCE84194.1 hypothetical protein GA0074695_1534 [Micromonospora viridifaciens]